MGKVQDSFKNLTWDFLNQDFVLLHMNKKVDDTCKNILFLFNKQNLTFMTCSQIFGPHGMFMCGRIENNERGYVMKKKRYTPEQIIEKLREAEVRLSKGESVGKMCRNIGVSEQTYYRWRNEYGGMRIDQAKRFKEIEKENTRLRKVVADLSLDNAILKEATKGNF